MTPNDVYEIGYRLEVDDDTISGRNVKAIKGYIIANFQVANFSTFRDIPKRSFCDGEVGDLGVGMNTICSWPEVVDDVVSGKHVYNFRYMLV